MKIIIRTCPGREMYRDALLSVLPDATIVADKTTNAMDTFLSAMEAAGPDAALHLEDDILLASNFRPRVEGVIGGRPGDVIQFFSRRSADVTVGSRWEPGRTFLMNQCFYLPAGYSADLREFARLWERYSQHPTGYDILMQDWLRARRERYWLHVPSLVQHRDCVSAINPRRSRSRQSATFSGEGA
jgi:hypothetical protein